MTAVDRALFGQSSIFEFPIDDMPNFWEQTQDGREYWKLTNNWMVSKVGHICLTVQFQHGMEYQIKGILCVAFGTSKRGDGEHAVVWRDGLLHDPHPSKAGINGDPDTFTVFVPVNLNYHLSHK